MQSFERSAEPPPRFLSGQDARDARRRLLKFFELDPLVRAQTRLSDHALELKDSTVFDGISRLFRGKCAFCEVQDSTLPYRFRPQASATPEAADSYLYYTWLANAWENIYPICVRCVPREPEYFPVLGKRAALPKLAQLRSYIERNEGLWRHYPIAEVGLLLDPCRNERFYEHFFVSVSGELFDKSTRGNLTIEHFRLNRPGLVSEREAVLRKYRADLLTRGVVQMRGRNSGNHSLFDFANMEFGGLWHLQCRLIVTHLSTLLGRNSLLSRSQIGNSFRLLCRNKLFDAYGERLHHWIENEDFGRLTPEGLPRPTLTELIRDTEPPLVNLHFAAYPALRSIELSQFKAITHLKLQLKQQSVDSLLSSDPVQPAMLILGENATGKSSILEATALGLSDLKTRKTVVSDLADLVLDPGYLGSPDQQRMAFSRIRLAFEEGPDTVIETDGLTWQQELAFLHPPVFAYGAFRQYQKNSAPYKAGPGISNLFDSARLLPDPEHWLLGLDEKQDFNDVARALRVIMAVDGDHDVIVKSDDRKRCLIVTRHGDVKTMTPLRHASSGYRSILAMVCDIMRRLMDRTTNPHYQSLENSRAIVLIDEVEAHLHPRWKVQIMSALRKALPKVTFIATSHDPLCVRGMHNGEVVVMHRTAGTIDNDDAKQLAQVEQLLDLPDITQLTIEQLLTSDFFSLASTDQPLMNLKLAQLADLLSASNNNGELDPEERQVVDLFKQEISDVLPVGSTEGQRLVQEAVAEFLQKRITASRKNLQEFEAAAKRKILAVLEGF